VAAALLPRDLKEKVRGDTSGGTEQMRRVDRIDSPDVVAMETSIARRPAVAAEKESATAVGGRGAEESTYAQWQRGRRRRARPRRRATAEEEVSAAVVMGSGGVESMRGTMPGVRRSGLFPRGKPSCSGWRSSLGRLPNAPVEWPVKTFHAACLHGEMAGKPAGKQAAKRALKELLLMPFFDCSLPH